MISLCEFFSKLYVIEHLIIPRFVIKLEKVIANLKNSHAPECNFYIPSASLYCGNDGYVHLKEKYPSGRCVFNGFDVQVGPFMTSSIVGI